MDLFMRVNEKTNYLMALAFIMILKDQSIKGNDSEIRDMVMV
jgi:hypothetical protein